MTEQVRAPAPVRPVPAGRVGIMSNAPQAALDVVGTGTSSAWIVPRDTTAADTFFLSGPTYDSLQHELGEV